MRGRLYAATAIVIATALFVDACGGSLAREQPRASAQVAASVSHAGPTAATDDGVPTWVWWTVGAVVAVAVIVGVAVAVTAHGASSGARNTQPPDVGSGGLLGG